MRPLRLRIQEVARQYGVPQNLIEKDYALSYALAGLASHPDLSDTLLFKGGTALKKVFFGDYRFSEDLDFSAQSAPEGRELESAIHQAVQHAAELLSEQGPFSVEVARRPEREPHPGGQDAFLVRIQFPWHPRPLCQIKVEITHDELVVLASRKRPVIHGYDEDLRPVVSCYQLEEIVAEKLRALLQTHQNIIARGWGRQHARDYYDLWRILDTFSDALNPQEISRALKAKAQHRRVSYLGIDDFFTDELVTTARAQWVGSLGPVVAQLPDFDSTVESLRELLQRSGVFP
jgi:predicted nucleotidyltransferase component of viral defense system